MIFISYRRIDTGTAAGRLYSDLARSFSRSQIFMDIDGHIARGAQFGGILRAALDKCRVMLALVGPQWTSCTRDGNQRLNLPDDWVRQEIRQALARDVLLVPVLLNGTLLPPVDAVPEDIRGFVDVQRRTPAHVRDDSWSEDLEHLIADIRRQVPELISYESSVHAIADAFTLMGKLARESPSVASAITEYRIALADVERQATETEVYKGLHDAFHNLEYCGLLQMQTAMQRSVAVVDAERAREIRGSALEICKAAALASRRQVEGYLRRGVVEPDLAEDIRTGLSRVAASLQSATRDGSQPAAEAAEAEVQYLLSAIPADLDRRLGNAASRLQRSSLTAVLTKVHDAVLRDEPAQAGRVEALFMGLNPLEYVREELGSRAREHSRLQRIDGELRSLLLGGGAGRMMQLSWRKVEDTLVRLERPLSPALQDHWESLERVRKRVAELLAAGDPQALEKIVEFYRTIGIAFLEADSELKEMCDTFAEIRVPLNAILNDAHGV